MEQCTVCIYDDNMVPASGGGIEILGTDHFGTNLDDAKVAQSLGVGEFGARINLPEPPEPIVIWVDDNLGRLAPTTLGHLNGRMTARLDVILYSLPGGPDGGRKGQVGYHKRAVAVSYTGHSLETSSEDEENSKRRLTPAMISEYISRQVNDGIWTESEATGVRSLVETTTRALNIPKRSSELSAKLERWSGVHPFRETKS
jgi:hypothetical protein